MFFLVNINRLFYVIKALLLCPIMIKKQLLVRVLFKNIEM